MRSQYNSIFVLIAMFILAIVGGYWTVDYMAEYSAYEKAQREKEIAEFQKAREEKEQAKSRNRIIENFSGYPIETRFSGRRGKRMPVRIFGRSKDEVRYQYINGGREQRIKRIEDLHRRDREFVLLLPVVKPREVEVEEEEEPENDSVFGRIVDAGEDFLGLGNEEQASVEEEIPDFSALREYTDFDDWFANNDFDPGYPVDREITRSGGKSLRVIIYGRNDQEVFFKRYGDIKDFDYKIQDLSEEDREFMRFLPKNVKSKEWLLAKEDRRRLEMQLLKFKWQRKKAESALGRVLDQQIRDLEKKIYHVDKDILRLEKKEM